MGIRIILSALLAAVLFCIPGTGRLAGQALTLDSCRQLALNNNKTLSISRVQGEKAAAERRAAHTNYLPKVALTASYMRTGKEISLLSDEQKGALGSLGTTLTGQAGAIAGQILQAHPDLAPLLQAVGGYLPQIGEAVNGMGNSLADALRTDTRNLTVGAIMLTQPLYMGGKIRAYDRITRYAESLADQQLRADAQAVILSTDEAYWQVVSLANKLKLAEQYRDLLSQLDEDIRKMVAEGVATKANALTVSVKLNEAEMALTKVGDGLTLSRMLLCQICGLPVETPLRLADETLEDLPVQAADTEADAATALGNRPEISQLQIAKNIYDEKIRLERSAFLPQLALMGGYLTTNPALTNGFETRFRGTWAVGVTLNVPVWNWGEGKYKVRAAKADANIAALRLADAQEKIKLQVHQSAFRVNEANKKLQLSLHHLEQAEENLRTADVGFHEGVITTSDLLAAQTAWLQAHSDKIDAQIDVRLSRSIYRKALGTLTPETHP